jgi:hypothetical protein
MVKAPKECYTRGRLYHGIKAETYKSDTAGENTGGDRCNGF